MQECGEQFIMEKAFDCGFTRENNWFRYRACAIIIEDDCVLQQLYLWRKRRNALASYRRFG